MIQFQKSAFCRPIKNGRTEARTQPRRSRLGLYSLNCPPILSSGGGRGGGGGGGGGCGGGGRVTVRVVFTTVVFIRIFDELRNPGKNMRCS